MCINILVFFNLKNKYFPIISILIIINSFVFSENRSQNQYDVFVSPSIKNTTFEKIAVLPFKSPTELAGTSISDYFTTEILRTYKYQLIERSQIENIFKEQEMNLSGVTDSTVAIEVGKILGVNGTVIGTVSEYGYQQYKASKLPSVGINVRLIDTTTGKIVWSISDSQVASSAKTSLSQHAKNMVGNMVSALMSACRDVGDYHASALPKPLISSYSGGVRSSEIIIKQSASKLISAYEVLRSNFADKAFVSVAVLSNSKNPVIYKDSKLQDSTLYFYKVRSVSKDKLVSSATEPVQVITEGPPASPENLKASGQHLRQIPLSWERPEDKYVTGYAIFRKKGDNSFEKIAIIKDAAKTKYLDKESRKNPIEDDTEYTYRICSLNCAGVKSKPSKDSSAVTLALPVKISNFTCQSDLVKSVKLSWDASPEPQVAGYNIYRYSNDKNSFKKITTLKNKNTTTFLDRKSLKDGSTYKYRIAAFYRKDAEGQMSEIAEAKTKPVPVEVKGLTASAGEVKQIALSWEANPEDDIKAYLIYKGKKPKRLKKLHTLSSDNLTFTDKNLKDGVEYYYSVAALDKDNLLGSESKVSLGKSKPIPKTVKNLSAEISAGNILLSWEENPEEDIAFYEIYSKKKLIGKAEDLTWTFTEGAPGKTYKFSLAAIDNDRLRSKLSKKIKIKIPKT